MSESISDGWSRDLRGKCCRILSTSSIVGTSANFNEVGLPSQQRSLVPNGIARNVFLHRDEAGKYKM